MKCEQCGKEFESKRRDARFCSSTCRSRFRRATDKCATDNATDKIPNAVTLRAVEELERGGGDSYEGVEEFLEDLDNPEPQSYNPMKVGYVPERK